VAKLLEVIARMMPSPLEGNPPPFFNAAGGDARPVPVAPDPAAHALGYVFKTIVDPFVGKLSVFRLYQGRVTRDSQLFVGDARKPFKVAHLFKLHGKEHREADAGIPGDLCAVAKVEDAVYGAVLHDSHDEDHIHMPAVALPRPMFALAVSARSRGDEQKLGDALAKLAAEDPCVAVEHEADTGDTVLKGLGELHLRVLLERMQQRFNVEVHTRTPRIAYRETIRVPAAGHHRHKKQTGGAGQFGEVYLRIEPLARGAGFEFEDEVVGGAIPNQFIPAVEKGVRQVLEHGAVAGYPMQDLRVTVYDGKHHTVDSKEVAFVAAARRAFMDAVSRASPVLLEPIVDIQITAPQQCIGDITGDLAGRRGRISGTRALGGGTMVISGQAPMSELSSFQSQLKSMTGGVGSYTLDFSHYDPVPGNVQQQLVAAFKPRGDED
jgi:elongation factor G